MHFDIDLDERLTAAISPTYEVGNYTGAIIAAIQSLSDVIRNKSGLDSDGQSLAGGAFGGTNPIIKLSALRTESERDEQKGMEALLRGLYTGLRNPRSHELRTDKAVDANAIIGFIDWMIRIIDGSKSPFDPGDIIERVLDEHFVATQAYASLLAAEVPPRIRLDVLTRLMDKVSFARAHNARAFVNAMLVTMVEGEADQFWSYVSTKLLNGGYDNELITLVRVCSSNWERVSPMARLRSENRLIKSVRDGRTDADHRTTKGTVGVRLVDLECKSLSLKEELSRVLVVKLLGFQHDERRYVYAHFMPYLASMQPEPDEALRSSLLKRLEAQDADAFTSLYFIDGLSDDHPWVKAFGDACDAFTFKDADIPF